MGLLADALFGEGWEEREDHARALYDMSVGKTPTHVPRLASGTMRVTIREMQANQRFHEERARGEKGSK